MMVEREITHTFMVATPGRAKGCMSFFTATQEAGSAIVKDEGTGAEFQTPLCSRAGII